MKGQTNIKSGTFEITEKTKSGKAFSFQILMPESGSKAGDEELIFAAENDTVYQKWLEWFELCIPSKTVIAKNLDALNLLGGAPVVDKVSAMDTASIQQKAPPDPDSNFSESSNLASATTTDNIEEPPSSQSAVEILSAEKEGHLSKCDNIRQDVASRTWSLRFISLNIHTGVIRFFTDKDGYV